MALLLVPTHDLRRPHASAHASPAAAVRGNQPDEGGDEGGNQPDEGGNQPDEGGNQPDEGGNQPDEGGNQPDEGGNQDGHQQERPLLAQPAPLPRPLLVRTDNIGVVQVGL